MSALLFGRKPLACHHNCTPIDPAHKNPREIGKISHAVHQALGQIIKHLAFGWVIHIERSEMYPGFPRSIGSREFDGQVTCMFNQPLRYFDRFNSRHRQSKKLS